MLANVSSVYCLSDSFFEVSVRQSNLITTSYQNSFYQFDYLHFAPTGNHRNCLSKIDMCVLLRTNNEFRLEKLIRRTKQHLSVERLSALTLWASGDTMEFFQNVFKNICHYSKRVRICYILYKGSGCYTALASETSQRETKILVTKCYPQWVLSIFRRSLNFCSCTTWFLNLGDLVRINRAWLYKKTTVL